MGPAGIVAFVVGSVAFSRACWALAGREVHRPLASRTKAIAALGICVTGLVAAWRTETPLAALATWCALASSVTIAVVDVAEYRIPNRIVFPAFGCTTALFVIQGLVDRGPVLRALAGGALFFGMLGAIFVLAPGRLGYGDVRFAALLGLPLGWQALLAVPLALFVSSASGIVIHAVLVVSKRRGWRDMLPFGLYLTVGTTVTVAIGGSVATALFIRS
jgi:leader peptidase (prepilin peptidase) / N-methyltransferase